MSVGFDAPIYTGGNGGHHGQNQDLDPTVTNNIALDMHIILPCHGNQLFDHRCRDRYHQTFEKNDFSPLLIVVTIGVVLALPEVLKILLDLVNQPLQPLLQLPFLLWLVKGLAKQDTIV